MLTKNKTNENENFSSTFMEINKIFLQFKNKMHIHPSR